jgi:hypothetical protein
VNEDEDDELHRVDTVPPPDGEGDAYSAPTRVGAGPPVQVLAALREAAASGRPLKPQDLPKGASIAPAAAPSLAPPAEMRLAEVTPSTAAPPAPAGDLGPAVARVALALAVVTGVYALLGR